MNCCRLLGSSTVLPALSAVGRFVARCIAVLFAGTAIATANAPEALILVDSGFSVRLPKSDLVAFRGMVNLDQAGGPNASMMYPGGAGLVGFIAAIATHGALVEASKNSEKARLQVEADKVLIPYVKVLEKFSSRDLIEGALVRLELPSGKASVVSKDATPTGWVLESNPVFTLTQDRSAVIVENAVLVYAANAPKQPRFQNFVRVVSNVRRLVPPAAGASKSEVPASAASSASPTASAGTLFAAVDALADDIPGGERLVQESIGLMAESIRLVLDELASGEASSGETQTTIRYQEGSLQKVERAHLVKAFCDRVVIRTLRGWLMSVPLRPNPGAQQQDCSAAPVK